MFGKLTGIALAIGALAMTPAMGASVADDAAAARAMTKGEVFNIYHDRTWLWSDGAGFFANSKREFTAYSGKGAKEYLAKGVWFITDPGKVCFRAAWAGMEGTYGKVTCFSHRISRNAYYQRREPDGEWYVFHDLKTMVRDEYSKLVRGDAVSRQYRARMQARADNGSAGPSCSFLKLLTKNGNCW